MRTLLLALFLVLTMTAQAVLTTTTFTTVAYAATTEQENFNIPVDKDSAMLGRELVARGTDKVGQMSANIPVGVIMAFPAAPAGAGDTWLACTGVTIPASPAYAELRKLLGSNKTPDLRALFLRGSSTLHGTKAGQWVPAQGHEHQHKLKTETITQGTSGTAKKVVTSIYKEGTDWSDEEDTYPEHYVVDYYIKAK